MAGRPHKEFDKKEFMNLVGMGCTQEEICWWFRDDTGKPANVDTLSRWCKRTFGENYQEYYKKNGGMALKISLRKSQLKLAEKSAAMAIFLGKNYLNQTDKFEQGIEFVEDLTPLAELLNEPEDN
jgi:hypothetical protein